MNRERDCRIARGLGWTELMMGPVIRGTSPSGLPYDIVPWYSDPSQTGPLLQSLLDAGWRVEWISKDEAGYRIAAIGSVRPHRKVEGVGSTLAEAVAELADKVLGRDE